MPDGLCECGCGRTAPIAKCSDASQGHIRGKPIRFIHGHNKRGMPQKPAEPLRTRLFSKLLIDPSGCLLWTGKLASGYGSLEHEGRKQLVHRLMYEMFVEPIPEGLELDHVKAWGCTHRNCGSPAHLEPVTGRENKIRADGIIAAHVAATHCGTCGTPYDEVNTYRSPDGSRNCRRCRRESDRRFRARKKAS